MNGVKMDGWRSREGGDGGTREKLCGAGSFLYRVARVILAPSVAVRRDQSVGGRGNQGRTERWGGLSWMRVLGAREARCR